MKARVLVAISAAVGVAGLVMLMAPSLYEVADKGEDLRPYDSGVVYQIQLGDSVTFYAAEESRPDMDAISGSVLVALATACLIAALILGYARRSSRLRRFYQLAGAAFALLALDEFFALHETVGHNLLPVTDLPGIERPDDVVFAALLIPALVFVYAYRDILLSSPRTRWLFGGAFAAFGLAAASDIAGASADEPLEILSGAFILGGFLSLIVAHLSPCIVEPEADTHQAVAQDRRVGAEPAPSTEPRLRL